MVKYVWRFKLATFPDIVKKLRELKKVGFVRTHRSGPTGIGKTLEDLLGITENNIPGPDLNEGIELKSARKNVGSMVTLFTKSPLPYGVNGLLLKELGYVTSESQGEKILHSTINGVSFNTLRGEIGLKIDVANDRIIFACNKKLSTVPYYDNATLQKCFEKKLPKLCFVKADARGSGATEEFWFNEAYLLEGFDFENFIGLIKSGDVLIDIRIGQFDDGSVHDHGTGFRIFPYKLDMCFSQRTDLLA